MELLWAHVLEIIGIVTTLVTVVYNYGKLNTRVDVLWHTVFNHLGQSAVEAQKSWAKELKRRKQGKPNASDAGTEK